MIPIPPLPRSGNHLVDNYDDELEADRTRADDGDELRFDEDSIDEAEYKYLDR